MPGIKEAIRVTLFDGSYDDTMMSVPEAIVWLRGVLDQIPEEYRDESVFQVETERGSHGDRLAFRVYYDRPEPS